MKRPISFTKPLSAALRASFFAVALTGMAVSFVPARAQALSGAEWSSGLIIDDDIFYNNGDMSVDSIQNFLNGKVPTCDTNGTQQYSSGVSRAQYGASRGYPPPYVCLKNFSENGQSGAQIIKAAADAHGISARALVITLQKEQALITDDWPWSNQYRNAMGFGCPDTAPCDPQYAGFTNQVHNAARQFRRYATTPTSYRHQPFQNNSVLYKPGGSCGASTVGIQSKASAGLYNYTPYQPNGPALNNLYGTGDGCSSYGNRNFWRMFNDWFGSTRAAKLPNCNVPAGQNIECVWRLYNPQNALQFLTSSISERNALVWNHGFILEAIAFYSKKAGTSGATPVYRVSHPGLRKHLWTNAASERDHLVSIGWVDEGIGFYMGNASTGTPIYRLSYAPLKKHLWTRSPIERDDLMRGGYTYEGVVYDEQLPLVSETPPPAGRVNVYRFSGFPNFGHFWTISEAERDALISRGFNYEGLGWTAPSGPTGTPVYRIYSLGQRKHFWTISQAERNGLLASAGYIDEGVGFYAADGTTGAPVYRISSPQLRKHFWTSSAGERDALVGSGWFINEGIGWYE